MSPHHNIGLWKHPGMAQNNANSLLDFTNDTDKGIFLKVEFPSRAHASAPEATIWRNFNFAERRLKAESICIRQPLGKITRALGRFFRRLSVIDIMGFVDLRPE